MHFMAFLGKALIVGLVKGQKQIASNLFVSQAISGEGSFEGG